MRVLKIRHELDENGKGGWETPYEKPTLTQLDQTFAPNNYRRNIIHLCTP